MLSDPGPGALAGECKSIFTARYEAGSSVRHGAGTSFGVDNTRTPSVLHHFNSILTSNGPSKGCTRTSRAIHGENIKIAIQRLVTKITSSFSLSHTHMNAIHPVLIANEHGYKDVPAQDKHRDFSREQCASHTCYTLMLALKDSFELDIIESSHRHTWIMVEGICG